MVEQLVKQLKDKVQNPTSVSLDYVKIDGASKPQNMDIDRLANEVSTPSFLSSHRLVEVRNSDLFVPAKSAAKDKITEVREKLIDFLAHIPEGSCLIFVEDKVSNNLKRLVKAVTTNQGAFVTVPLQKPDELSRWIARVLKARALLIHRNAGESLIMRCENSMGDIYSELQKLTLYASHIGEKAIDLAMVEEVCRRDLRGRVFDLTDAISIGDVREALRLLDVLFSQREPAQRILVMICRHLRHLLAAKDRLNRYELAAKLKVPDFVAKNLQAQERHFTLSQLFNIYELCCLTDALIKQGRIEDKIGLELLVVEAGMLGATGKVGI